MQIQESDLRHPPFPRQLCVLGERQQTVMQSLQNSCSSYCFFLASVGLSGWGCIPLTCNQCPQHITILLHRKPLHSPPHLSLCFRQLIPIHSPSLPFQQHSPQPHGTHSALLALPTVPLQPGSGSHSVTQLSMPVGLLPLSQP